MRKLRSVLAAVGFTCLLAGLAACGGQAGSIEILPVSPLVNPGETVAFSALANGEPANKHVSWSVEEENGGTIDALGNYTAPDAEGTFTIVASTPLSAKRTQVKVQKGIHVRISPSSATVEAGERLTFTANVTGRDKRVTWSVDEDDGGTISDAGVYTAPAQAGTYHVVATSVSNPDVSERAAVTVTTPVTPPPVTVAITVSPQTVSIPAGTTVQLDATVSGTTDVSVTWSVSEEGGGTVTNNGLYSAPTTAGTYHVVATSHADATKTATATITVTEEPTPPPTVSIVVSPKTASVEAGNTVQLEATVSGSSDDAVTWKVSEQGGGTVSASGLYTAPNDTGTFHVVATSHADPTKSATATLTVTAPPAPVTLSVSPKTATVAAKGTVQLTAAVGGTTNVGVTWKVSEQGGGSVTSSGLYTAPDAAGTFHVVATSQADTSKSATATITVTKTTTPPPPSGVGTGATHQPQHITNVTGGGAMPDTRNAPVANCAGNGSTDDTTCLQNAIYAAAAAHQPLLIPATSAYYKISNRLFVTTSLIGINGMPTIKTVNMNRNLLGDVLQVESSFSGWIYNLHLVGTFNGTGDASGQWAHTIDLGCASNVTISGNLLENAAGDAVSTDRCHNTGGQASNVLIANNTMKGMFRCAVAFIWNIRDVVVRDNLIDKQSNFVSGIDFEPEANGTVLNVEVTFNEFAMYNSVPYYPWEGSDGKAVSGWQVSSNPGGNYYIHHNYGHYGTGFGGEFGGSNWGYRLVYSNDAGPMPSL